MTNSEKIEILKSIQIVVYFIDEQRLKSIRKQIDELNIMIDIHYFKGFTPANSSDFIDDKHPEVEHVELPGHLCCTKSFAGAVNWFVQNCKDKKFLITIEDDACFIKRGFQNRIIELIENYKKMRTEIDYVSIGYHPCDINYIKEKRPKVGTIYHDFWKANRLFELNESEPIIWGTVGMLFDMDIALSLNEVFYHNKTSFIRSEIQRRIQRGFLYSGRYDVLLIDHCIPVIYRQSICFPPLVIESQDFSYTNNKKINRDWSNILDINYLYKY
jgi:hypothetical protein